MVVQNLRNNAATAKEIIARTVPKIPLEARWPCHRALENSILTDKTCWPAKTKSELRPLLARYL
jgi:hypothetical protein